MASRVTSKWFGQHKAANLSASDGRHSWERFAEVDPYLYILTNMKRTDPRAFWESGERLVKIELLPVIQSHAVRPFVAMEVGCGIGRLVLPLSRTFRHVVGVDIASGMVQRATSFANDNGIKNVSFAAISGPEDLLKQTGEYSGTCDFIYSLLVFQHIPEFSIIEGYLHVIRTLLHKRGIAYLQFDTRRAGMQYRLKTRLPDFLLPRFWRRGIRRIRRSSEEIETCIRRAGLEVIEQRTPDTEYHRYILRLSQSGQDSR
ncbi:MAG: class I SAM-dependent methyltransferase [Candidatus Acidiferrum sp.]|jgi:SAM-dependent methyltransferase